MWADSAIQSLHAHLGRGTGSHGNFAGDGGPQRRGDVPPQGKKPGGAQDLHLPLCVYPQWMGGALHCLSYLTLNHPAKRQASAPR